MWSALTGLASKPQISRDRLIHRLFTLWRASDDSPWHWRYSHTHCANTVHIDSSSTAFERYQTCVHVRQLNEINVHVDFWMFGAHDNSVVLLVGSVKHMACKIPHSLYTRQACGSAKIYPTTQSQGQFSPWSCQDLELSSLSKLSVKLF